MERLVLSAALSKVEVLVEAKSKCEMRRIERNRNAKCAALSEV